MKPFLRLLATLSLIALLPACALAEDHTHQLETFSQVEGTSKHIAVCTECGETVTESCVNTTITFGGVDRGSVCSICGASAYGAFEALEAEAVPLAEKPSTQRGVFRAFGKENPFAAKDPSILYAFVIGYDNAGKAATFKNKSTVTLNLGVSLPEGFILQRITPSSGDDSTQTDERRTDIDYTYEDGLLTFESKHAAMYIITAAN